MSRKPRRTPVIAGPRQIERRYSAALVAMVKDIEREIRDQLIDALPRLAQMRDATGPRQDSWDLEIERLIAAITVFGTRRAERIIGDLSEFAEGVNRFNRRSFARAMANIIGVDFTRGADGQWLQIEMRSWAAENAALIKSIPERMLTEVEGIAQRALRTGADPRETAREIRDRFGVTEARARLIGRDQVSKLNGQITQGRNQALGLDLYIWSSSVDERVRETHDVMEGKVCKWDDDSVYADTVEDAQAGRWKSRASIGGVDQHPGQDFQCRCVSRAVIPPEFLGDD